jgi:peptide deformylase
MDAIDKSPGNPYNNRVDDQVLEIIKFGNDILTAKASEIKQIDERIIHLATRMTEAMHHAPGVGLAAPQVGKSIRLATVDISVGENPEELLILINPRIIAQEESETDEEGCLSFPGYSVPISRYRRILLGAISLDGKEIRLEAEGLKARAIQHELDHLNGLLIIDRISTLKRNLIKQEIKKLRKSGKW